MVWAGQYNAEYWGSDTITLFDNRCDLADDYANSSSRLLVLKESESVVTIEFEYELRSEFPYGYSPSFGDADLMPSGNLVASWWPNVQHRAHLYFYAGAVLSQVAVLHK